MKRYLIPLFVVIAKSSIAQVTQMPIESDYREGDEWVYTSSRVGNNAPEKILSEGSWCRKVVRVDGQLRFSTGSETVPIPSTAPSINERPRIAFPLEVGKKWEYVEDWTSGDGTTGNTTQDAEVVAFEKVTVPAGTFMAFKIVYRGAFKTSHGSGKMDDIIWYAPQVKARVKFVNDNGYGTYTEVLAQYSASTR